jgi:type II secretory pathway pseudopilin PulG
MKRLREGSDRRRGWALLEVLIVVILFSIGLGSAIMVTARSYDAFRTTRIQSTVEGNARATLNRIATELAAAERATLQPNPDTDFGSDSIRFRVPIDFDDRVAMAPLWGTDSQLLCEYESGEIDDDVDNNGNGLVDERVLVFVRNVGLPNESRTVLCHGVCEVFEGETLDGTDENGNDVVDEAGFNVHRVGDMLWIRLSVEAPDANGELVVRSVETAIKLRN